MAVQGVSIPKLGDVIAGRYELTGELGKGGFGMVFKATQMGMNRPVALKVLLPQAASVDTVVERFQREAQLAKNLVHPNTIQLFDFGETESGCLFIAMEYLDGQTLDDLLKREGPLTMDRVVHIAIQILKSLAEAHEHGIIHRDLKPANIFMRHLVGEKDFVKVLDFGIAKALNIDGAEEKQLTQTGSAFGTPSYMPPEQIKGAEMGPYTDLYALGLIMLKVLTGRTMVEGGTPIETAAIQLSPMPIAIPEQIAQGPLGPVIARALAKRFQERYQTALEMLRDLQQLQPLLRSGVMPAYTGPMSPQGATPRTGQHFTGGYGGGEVSVGFVNDQGLSGPMPLPVQPHQPKRASWPIVLAVVLVGVAVGVVVYLFVLPRGADKGAAEASERAAATAPTDTTATATAPTSAPVADPPPTPTPLAEDTPPTPPPSLPPEPPKAEVTAIAVQSDPVGAFVYDITDLAPEADPTTGRYLGSTPFNHNFDGKTGTRVLALTNIGFTPAIQTIDLASPRPVAVQLMRTPAPEPPPVLNPPVADPPTVATDNPDQQPSSTDKKPSKTKPDRTKTDKTKTDKTKPDTTTKPDTITKPDTTNTDTKQPKTTIVLPD
jgi:eukaryotic-like serine/threonine-protein kinase